MLGITLKSSMEPLGGDLKCELPIPKWGQKKVKADIKLWAKKIQRNSDIIDVLCRIGKADPAIQNDKGETCFDLAVNKFPYIMHHIEEQVVHLEHLAEQDALIEEDEDYEPEPYVWKADHTDLADIEGRAARALLNAQTGSGIFAKADGSAQSKSMHTKGGTNDYTTQT